MPAVEVRPAASDASDPCYGDRDQTQLGGEPCEGLSLRFSKTDADRAIIDQSDTNGEAQKVATQVTSHINSGPSERQSVVDTSTPYNVANRTRE